MSRGFYQRQPRDVAVTMLTARPMLNIFFPELTHFEQPLSGEVCARKTDVGKIVRCIRLSRWMGYRHMVSDRDSHARLSRQGGFPGKQESYII